MKFSASSFRLGAASGCAAMLLACFGGHSPADAAGEPATEPLRFVVGEAGSFTFDTGVLKGVLREGGRSSGLVSVTAHGSALSGGNSGLFNHYRVFTRGIRYGDGARSWPSTAELHPDGSVEVVWMEAPDRPFELRATYRLIAANTIEVVTTVQARQKLEAFEVWLASYFGPTFNDSRVWASRDPRGGTAAGFVSADSELGDWLAFPRDERAVAVIEDGRWTLGRSPLTWTMMPAYARPLAFRRDINTGITGIVLGRSSDCFGVFTPHRERKHMSNYLSLFGHDLAAGETASAVSRLVVLSSPTEEEILGIAEPAAGRVYANPILPGDWSDPGLIRVGDYFYTVRSSFGWQPGLPIARSRDLLHWELIGHGFKSHPKLLPGDTRHGIWGVDMGWNPNTRQFLIYAPTRDGEVYVYHADRPEGPYAGRSLGADLGIDPGFFADEDGRLYFLTNRALIHELESDGLSIKGPVAQIDRTPFQLFEGPSLFRRGDYYYLLFSDGGTLPHEPSTISVLRASSLAGPWDRDPGNPVMFATDSGAQFEGPAHGTLIETAPGEWYVGYHAHETAYSTLGRQFLLEPITWTADGWWRPEGGRIPTTSAYAPSLPPVVLKLQQSDEFEQRDLGLQWFFTCAPDFSGNAWSLRDRPGILRITTQPGTLHELSALPGILQQRLIDKSFSFETRLNFEACDGREAAGLHLFHDPLMNLWLAVTVRDGKKRIAVGRHTLGVRTDLWSVANPYGDGPVHLKIVVTDPESATFFHSPDGTAWRQLGDSIYFGSSGHHLRDGRRGDPDLGWVGRYKEKGVSSVDINGLPEYQRQANRGGNIWTGATFGVFAVQDGAPAPKAAWFDYVQVNKTPAAAR